MSFGEFLNRSSLIANGDADRLDWVSMTIGVIRMLVKNRHPGNDKAKDEYPYGNNEHGYGDLHPVREITLGRRQVIVKGDQADVEAVDNDSQYRPDRRVADHLQVAVSDPHRVEKRRQSDESNQLHHISE